MLRALWEEITPFGLVTMFCFTSVSNSPLTYFQTTSANCVTVSEEYIYIGCADGIVRIFSPYTLEYVTSLPRPHYLGVDVAAATTPA